MNEQETPPLYSDKKFLHDPTSPLCDVCERIGVPDLWPIPVPMQQDYDLRRVNYFRRLCSMCRKDHPEFTCLPPKAASNARSTPA